MADFEASAREAAEFVARGMSSASVRVHGFVHGALWGRADLAKQILELLKHGPVGVEELERLVSE